MKKKGFIFALISGILDILFALGSFGAGGLIAISGLAVSSNPLINLATLGATYAVGIVFVFVGLLCAGLGVVFLIFGIKMLVISSSKPENYKNAKGKFLSYGITETVFFALSLIGLVSIFEQTSTAIAIYVAALIALAINVAFKYVAYGLLKSTTKTSK